MHHTRHADLQSMSLLRVRTDKTRNEHNQSAYPLMADIQPGIFPLPHAPEIAVIFNPNLPRALAYLWARFGT
jgi:hypothetical protein